MQIVSALKLSGIRRLWSALVFSAIGDELYSFAVVLMATASVGVLAGYLLAIQAIVILLSTLTSGALTERFPHRRLMVTSDLIRAFGSAIPAICLGLMGHLAGWAFVLTLVLVSYFRPVFDPALQVTIVEVGGPSAPLQAINSLFDAMRRIARIVGPALAAFASSVGPISALFLMNSATFLLSAAVIVRLPKAEPMCSVEPEHQPASRIANNLRGLRFGFAALRQQSAIHFHLVSYAACNGAWYVALIVGLALRMKEQFPKEPGVFGYAIAVYGLFNVFSNLVCSELKRGRPLLRMSIGRLVSGIGLMIVGAAPNLVGIMLGSAVAALGAPVTQIPLAMLLQSAFDRDDISRVFRLRIFYEWSFLLVATLSAPTLFTILGVRVVTFLSCGLYLLLGGMGMRQRYRVGAECSAM